MLRSWRSCVEPVVHGEPAGEGTLDHLLGLLLVELLLGALDEREHVAHAEDARRHAVGRERLEVGDLLADAAVHDRLADGLAHRQRGTAARVAVELGEDHAVDADGVIEPLGDVHRLLAGHGVDGEDHLVHGRGLADVAQLVEQRLVDLQTAGGVEDDDVAVEPLGLRDAARGRAAATLALPSGTVTGIWLSSAELLELLHRRRAA